MIVLIMFGIHELTGVARFSLALLDGLVDEVTDDDEQSNYYGNTNNTNSWPKWAEST